MKQGILFRNKAGYFALDDNAQWCGGESIIIFDEDDHEWFEGTVEVDEFGEWYFTNGFLVVYLYEGLLVRV